jgi:beta-glucosidase
MSRDDKISMMTGIGWENYNPKTWWYVGNIPAVAGKFSGLNMQDAGNGYRTNLEEIVGTVTVWPSALSLGATWDRQIAHSTGVALGKEFKGKGANVILGPSINVHRYARGGRNFEYLSGDDPTLGAKLAYQWVDGVQSQNVIACGKHFAGNQQETERDNYNSKVDDKTAFELYFPPYQSAIDAGVGSFMCSYNKWNGEHACSSSDLLNNKLKGAMGFQGFVMSDWGAAYDQADRGLDMDMRMVGDTGNPSSQSEDVLDNTATRIIAATLKTGADWLSCTGACESQQRTQVTNDEHAELATAAAAASVVLLKNDGVLPFGSSVKSIAVVGEVATADPFDSNHGAWNVGDYYSGGGSGHMTPSSSQLVKTMDGLKARASKSGISVIESASNDQGAARNAASQADVVVVVVGASSSESADRDSLDVDNDGNGLINACTEAGKPVVVLMQIPGVVLTPWRDSVSAAAAMFLGGQGTGDAWARVLFGDVAPSGRLPVQFPASESDTIPVVGGGDATYSEGMKTSYRNKDIVPAFAFGHGLTYTNFSYGDAVSSACGDNLCLTMPVTNTGLVAASDVPQLYLEFPSVAQHPAPLLKGFVKTEEISPGKTTQAVFELTDRDLSYWDNGEWKKPATVNAHIGMSSANIVQTIENMSTQPDGPTPAPTTTTPSPSAPTTTTTPSPSDCPGGTLPKCIDMCPTGSDTGYQLCVDECLRRCPQEVVV